MALDFPSSPTNGQTYTYGGVTYYYDANNISWTTTFIAPPGIDFGAANNWANTKLANVIPSGPISITYDSSAGIINATINLSSSGVTSATYGGPTNIPVIDVDTYGRITSAANVTVQGMDYSYANQVGASSNAYAGLLIFQANAYSPVKTFSITTTPNLIANTDNTDLYVVSAQATTINIAVPTGSITEGERLMLRIKDSGVARTITWNTAYRSIGLTLPTTTIVSKTLYVGLSYNSVDSKWDVIALAQE